MVFSWVGKVLLIEAVGLWRGNACVRYLAHCSSRGLVSERDLDDEKCLERHYQVDDETSSAETRCNCGRMYLLHSEK